MTPTFAARLAERVLGTFVIAFIGTYVNILLGAKETPTPVLGQVSGLLQNLESLSLLHKAVVAGGLAVFQMALGLVGSGVGDPNDPALLPRRLLQPGLHEPPVPVGRYAASDELQHTLQQAAAANPNEPLTTQSVLAVINANSDTPVT